MRSSPPAPNGELWAADLQPRGKGPRQLPMLCLTFARSPVRQMASSRTFDPLVSLADLNWIKLESSAVAPTARWRHSATPISKTKMMVFGGLHSGSQRLNDTWIFDSVTKAWTQVLVPGVSANQGGVSGSGRGLNQPRGLSKHSGGPAMSMAVGKGAGSVSGAFGRQPSLATGGAGRATSIGSAALGGTSFLGNGGLMSSFVANALAQVGGGGAELSSFGTSFSASTDDVLADVGQPVEESAAVTTVSSSGSAHTTAPLLGDEVPAPRAAHSAVCIGDYVWLFGGYGGAGYARRDYGDVHKFHIPSQTWSAVKTTGDMSSGGGGSSAGGDEGLPSHPAPRSGHIAVAVNNTMIIHGGWNVSTSFQDTWALDTTTASWKRISTSMDGPDITGFNRWGHAAVAVPAVPNWQVFVFGGSTNTLPAPPTAAAAKGKENAPVAFGSNTGTFSVAGEPAKPSATSASSGGTSSNTAFLGETLVLDTGSYSWTQLAIKSASAAAAPAPTTTTTTSKGGASPQQQLGGALTTSVRPAARSDTAIIFDPFNKRLLMFGGWANRWLGDA